MIAQVLFGAKFQSCILNALETEDNKHWHDMPSEQQVDRLGDAREHHVHEPYQRHLGVRCTAEPPPQPSLIGSNTFF